jgi:outer membrane lipoprotein SlyB
MASSRIKTYGTNGTFVGIPGGHPLTSGLGAIILGVAAGYVGKSMGGESSMLVCAIFGVIAGYLGGDAVGSGIQEYYRSEERRG